jgi:hypothetical protein
MKGERVHCMDWVFRISYVVGMEESPPNTTYWPANFNQIKPRIIYILNTHTSYSVFPWYMKENTVVLCKK